LRSECTLGRRGTQPGSKARAAARATSRAGLTVDQEEAWLFEATRALLEQLGVRGADAQVEALLAEGQETLLAALPAGWLDIDRLECVDTAQQTWVRELSRWRAEAECVAKSTFGIRWLEAAASSRRGPSPFAAAWRMRRRSALLLSRA
jgi:hypothetical protein